jgi:penicillin-binding protein 2
MMMKGVSSQGQQDRQLFRMLIFVCLSFIVLIGRLAYLTLYQGQNYHLQAESQFTKNLKIKATRGDIYDRKGVLLVSNRPTFDLFLTVSKLKDRDALLKGLSVILGFDSLDLLQLQEKIDQLSRYEKNRPFKLAQDIQEHLWVQIQALTSQVGGISMEVSTQRYYSQGEIGAHLLGYLGKISLEELQAMSVSAIDSQIPQKPSIDWILSYPPLSGNADALIGRFGLERRFEHLLRGKDGYERYIVDAKGKRVQQKWADILKPRIFERVEAQRGADLYLTIDARTQRILYEALEGYQSGAIVMLDPRNGEILGMVSKPSFDPNLWSGRLSKEAKQVIDLDPHLPMLDKAVKSYFPGSIYKVVTALAGMQEGILDPHLKIDSPGKYTYGNRIFHCHKLSGHGKVDLSDALAASADVYFYKLGEKMGIDKLAEYGYRFGFGQTTSLEINGEASGVVPTKAFHEAHGGFQHGLSLSTAIGQGNVKVTPLQAALAFAAISHQGTLFEPQILKKVSFQDGYQFEISPRIKGNLDFKAEELKAVQKGLFKVVHDPTRGTAKLAKSAFGHIAGKTGTAQVKKINRNLQMENHQIEFFDRDHAWFASYAPYENPKVVVIVFLEHGGSGGKDAAPIAGKIIDSYHRQVEAIFDASDSISHLGKEH